MKKLWYAVIESSQNPDYGYDWGYGSENIAEAIKMARELDEKAFIAVIDTTDDDPMCVDEIQPEEFDRYTEED